MAKTSEEKAEGKEARRIFLVGEEREFVKEHREGLIYL